MLGVENIKLELYVNLSQEEFKSKISVDLLWNI